MEPIPSAVPITPPSRQRIFITRLASTLALWGIVLLALMWQSKTLFIGIAIVLGVLGSVEYFYLVSREPRDRAFGLLGLFVGLCWWAFTVNCTLFQHRSPPVWYDLAALIVTLQGTFLLCYRHELENSTTLRRVFATVFGVLYTVVCYGFLVRVLFFAMATANQGPATTRGIALLLYLIASTKFSDMGAYLLGSLIGKHKMIPHISPAKSWEGLVGAILGTALAATVLWFSLAPYLAPLTPMHCVILVPVLCFAAVTGDLAESILKRCLAIKDTGHKFPGIGGILDLTDSLLFTAPVFYFYLTAIS